MEYVKIQKKNCQTESNMIFLILSPLYLLAIYYILRRCLKWMGACHFFFHSKWFQIPFIILYVLVSTSAYTSFLLPSSQIQRFLKLINNYWLGCLVYIALFLGAADLIRLILKFTRVSQTQFYNSKRTFVCAGLLVFVLILCFSVYGMVHVRNIRTKSYQVTVAKECGDRSNLRIVLVADMHLGYSIGVGQMERMVEKINAQDPDIVCIAGDIFDNEYEALDDPEALISILKGIKSRYGVYSCYGNHDVSERLLMGFTLDFKAEKLIDDRMDDFLKRAGIYSLKDEVATVDDAFYLIGRLDYSKPGNREKSRKTIEELTEGLDRSKPVILVEHQPKELQRAADAGVDIALSGHTHDGQLFPANLTVKLAWENAYGYLKKGNLHSFVTSGVGVWGPNMRVGTDSEIMVVDVSFE